MDEIRSKEDAEKLVLSFQEIVKSYGGLDGMPEAEKESLISRWSRVILEENYRASIESKSQKRKSLELDLSRRRMRSA